MCKLAKIAREFNPKSECYAKEEAKRIGYQHAVMDLLKVAKFPGSIHSLIKKWEAEVGYIDTCVYRHRVK